MLVDKQIFWQRGFFFIYISLSSFNRALTNCNSFNFLQNYFQINILTFIYVAADVNNCKKYYCIKEISPPFPFIHINKK